MKVINEVVIKDCCITSDDTRCRVGVNGHICRLSPMQYHLFRTFMSATLLSPIPCEVIILAYRSRQDIQGEMELSYQLLRKHISNLNVKIGNIGLRVRPFQDGYLLTFSSPLHTKGAVG